MLKRQIAQILPNITYDSMETWLGHRPALPDSRPMIGALDKAHSVFTAFGHQHVGLTAGPKTGRVLDELITNKTTNQSLSAYAPSRF